MKTMLDSPALLHLGGENKLTLYELGRFSQVCRELPRPKVQKPRVVQFVGNRERASAVKHFFSCNNLTRKKQHCLASLRADNASTNSDSPLFFIESDYRRQYNGHSFISTCRDAPDGQALPWQLGQHGHDNVDLIHCRLLFLFADVVCLFLDDFPDSDSASQLFHRWLLIESASVLPQQLRPRLVFVTSQNDRARIAETLCQVYLSLQNQPFSSVQVLRLEENGLSPVSKVMRLRDLVLTLSSEVYCLRDQHSVLFTATHLQALFRAAAMHCTTDLYASFDPLHIARLPVDPNVDLRGHLKRFAGLAQRQRTPYHENVAFVASALALEAYPPDMHIFDPIWVFQMHYASLCLEAFQSYGKEAAKSYCADISIFLSAIVSAMQRGTSSADLRLEFMRTSKLVANIKSNLTCFSCLRLPPEHLLSCGHSICDNCLLIFATCLPNAEYQMKLDLCLLCQKEIHFVCRVKPPTAGVRVISVDGGGTRGTVPLESLCLLQTLLGRLPVRECFELGFGTSSGGIILLGLYKLLWDPEKCSAAFDQLSAKMFGQSHEKITLLSSLRKVIRCWVMDGVHNAEAFEEELKAIFGAHSCLFGNPECTMSGARFAVTTASISDASPFVLSNYNGIAPRSKYHGYEVLRPENNDDELLVWEAARATSAAPLFYKTVRLGDFGDFQDGGLKHNNPCRLAYWELRRIWPSLKAPDIYLSLGTGTVTDSKVSTGAPSRFRHILLDGFIPRLFRSCMSKADGEVMWGEFMNSLDEKARPDFYRLNIPLPGAAMIDDVEGMAKLRASVRACSTGSVDRVEIAKALVVSCFYFELASQPAWTSAGYLVQGSVKCRSDSHLVIETMASLGLDYVELSTDSEVLTPSTNLRDRICFLCRRYKEDVHFYLRHPSELITIYMQPESGIKRKLSGFPQTVDWFVTQQRLDRVFGSPDHDSPALLKCYACSGASRGSKRSNAHLGLVPRRKRTRLSQTLVTADLILEYVNEVKGCT